MADTAVPVSENLKRINAALALREIPDYPAALAQLTLALQADPHSALAQLLVGLTYQDLGHPQLAQACFAQALELEPDSAQIRQAYGLFLIRHAKYQEAMALTTFLFEHDKHESALIQRFASAFWEADQVDDAIDLLRQGREQWPQDAEIARRLAHFLAEVEEVDEAIAVLESITELSPDADSLLYLASLYAKKKDYASAVKPLQRASQLQPDNVRPWEELSECYFSLNDYEQAIAAADQAIQRDPNNFAGWISKWGILYSLSQADKSYLASLDESLANGLRAMASAADRQKPLYWFSLNQWLVFRDRNVNSSAADSAATAWFEHTLEKKIYNLGFFPTCEENWQRAQDLLTLVKQHGLGDPAIADANLGYIYLRQHQYELAAEALRAAIQAAHQDSTALLHVAAWINGDFSRTDIERFPHRLTSIRLVALSNLATAYWLSGKPEEAFATIQEAIANAPQDNIGYRVSGCLRLAHGEVELAHSEWEKALDLAEDKTEAALIEGWLATLPSVQK